MPREPVGSRSKYAQSLMPSHLRHFQLLGPDAWPAEITRMHGDYSLHYYDKPQIGMSEFRETVDQVLTLSGAKPEVIAACKQLSKALSLQAAARQETTQVAAEPNVTQQAAAEIDFGFLDDLDLNEAPPSAAEKPTAAPSPLRAEMHAYVRDVASKWTKDKPFFVRRSVANPTVMLIPTSVGTAKATGEKTNLNCAIGSITLNKLGPDHLLFENDSVVVESYDHVGDGRTYYVRAFHLTLGTTVRLFISELMDPKDPRSWKQINQRRVMFDPSLPHGCTVSG